MNEATYRVRDGYPKQNCAEQWTKHRKRTRIVCLLFVGWIPYGYVILNINQWLHVQTEIFSLLSYLSFWPLWSTAFWCHRSYAQRCGSRFTAWGQMGSWIQRRFFVKKCHRCGLRKVAVR